MTRDPQPLRHLPLRRLTERREFVRVTREGKKRAMPGVVLQACPRRDADDIGIGFTASKKVGKAVVRNRARRRLKEAARLVLPHCAQPGHDYVLVARRETPARKFADLIADLRTALDRMKLCRTTRPTRDAAR